MAAAAPIVPQAVPPVAQPAAQAATSWAPTAKVSAGVLAASVTPLLLLLFKKMTGSDLSASQGAAVTTIVTFIIQYLVPERK